MHFFQAVGQRLFDTGESGLVIKKFGNVEKVLKFVYMALIFFTDMSKH